MKKMVMFIKSTYVLIYSSHLTDTQSANHSQLYILLLKDSILVTVLKTTKTKEMFRPIESK